MVGLVDALKRDAIDGGEHERHKHRCSHQTIQTGYAIDEYCAGIHNHGTDGKNHEQATRVDVFHQECADETTEQEHAHCANVIELGSGFVDAKTVGILYDKCPCHDLRCHIEHLSNHTFAINAIAENAFHRFGECGFGLSGELFIFLAGIALHKDSYHYKHHQHHATQNHIRVANHFKVVQANGCLCCFVEGGESHFAHLRSIALQRSKHHVRRHKHAHERAHGVERLRQV